MRHVLAALTIAVAMVCCTAGRGRAAQTEAAPARAMDRPNIVLIISDDQDYEHLGFMGNPLVHTPELDKLARAGVVFTTAHLPMSRCHPTLASFLSGRWPHQTGIYYNYGTEKLDPHNSLPSLLKQAGYATYVEGKYWEGDIHEMGFTHGKRSAQTFVRKGQDELFAFIDDVGGKKPLFIWWAPRIPHQPHNPPKKYLSLFDKEKTPVPPYVKDGDGFRQKEWLSFGMEAWLDDGVGQLVAKMKAKGLHEHTLYVFVIDNGWCNGLVSKGSPFEKGVRTPVFFSWPAAIKGGRRVDSLISTLDIFPTILDLAGVATPKDAAGRTLLPALQNKPGAEAFRGRDELFGAIYPAFATKGDERPERDVYALYVRTKKWKYIYYVQDVTADRNGNYFRIQSILTDYPTRRAGDQDLYDLESDPHELHNLSSEPDQGKQLTQFKARVLQWWKDTGGKPIAAK
jgi:arylsulfatase A-like enzyme